MLNIEGPKAVFMFVRDIGPWINFYLPRDPSAEFVDWCGQQADITNVFQHPNNCVNMQIGLTDEASARERVLEIIAAAAKFLDCTFTIDDQGVCVWNDAASLGRARRGR